MNKLFISGFPLNMTELEIVQIVAPHGQVTTIKIVRDKATKICKGYAFLEMATPDDAELAITGLDGTSIAPDRVLTVRPATEKAAPPVWSRPAANKPFRQKRPRLAK